MEGLRRQPWYSVELGKGWLELCILFGATGLPQLKLFDSSSGAWINAADDGASPKTFGPAGRLKIKRISAGLYTVYFVNENGDASDTVPLFQGLGHPSWETTSGIPSIDAVSVKAASVPVGSASSFQIQCSTVEITKAIIDGDATSVLPKVAADPASGEALKLPVFVQLFV